MGRLQSGTPVNLQSGRFTVNQNDAGVVLHNITAIHLQSEMGVYKTSNVSANGTVTGTVWEGNRIFLYGPWISKWDVSMVKTTRIRENLNFEFRVQALNIFNFANFELPAGGGPLTVGTSFGQTTTAFRDFNNTNGPRSRTIEFVFRLNF